MSFVHFFLYKQHITKNVFYGFLQKNDTKIRGVTSFWKNNKGSEIFWGTKLFSTFEKSGPTGYPVLKKTNPLRELRSVWKLQANLGGNFVQFLGPFRLVLGDLMGETSAAVLGPSVIFEGTFGQFWGNCRSVLGDLMASFESRNFEKKSQVISRLCLKRSISNFPILLFCVFLY